MGRETIDREARTGMLLGAAESIFMRFGYARTTMGLLADAAGMSRPALYLLFPGKDEIFSALVLGLNRRQLDVLGERIAPIPGLHDKLLTACLAWNESVFDVHAAHPESRDMDDLGFPAVRALYDDLSGFFASTLAAHGYLETDAALSGRTLAFAARGCRIAATDRGDMTAMIRALVAAIARPQD